jgi:hypothetical protein
LSAVLSDFLVFQYRAAKKAPFHKADGEHIEFLVLAHCASSGQMRKMLLLGAQKHALAFIVFLQDSLTVFLVFSAETNTRVRATKQREGISCATFVSAQNYWPSCTSYTFFSFAFYEAHPKPAVNSLITEMSHSHI